jgi:hypothetical protein
MSPHQHKILYNSLIFKGIKYYGRGPPAPGNQAKGRFGVSGIGPYAQSRAFFVI